MFNVAEAFEHLMILSLGFLAWLLVTTVLRVMAATYLNAVALHDRVCEAKRLRLRYFQTTKQESSEKRH